MFEPTRAFGMLMSWKMQNSAHLVSQNGIYFENT